MIKQTIHTQGASVTKGDATIDWQAVRSEVSSKVGFINKAKCHPVSSDEAEDVVQEACVKIFLHLDEFDPSKAKFSTWIGKITANCYYDALRKKANEFVSCSEMSDLQVGVADDISHKEVEEMFSLALEPLCETYRDTIRCLADGESGEYLLDRLHCSEKSLRSTICRARKAARNSFKNLDIL